MARKLEHVNEDGSRFTVRTVHGVIGAAYNVTHSEIGTAGGILLRIDGGMYYQPRGTGGQLLRIRHDKYAYAANDTAGAELALAFFADSYAASCKHAAEEGIPVRDCFAAE